MFSFGKSIRIYLKDGTVTGIKFGEVVNQTIQSISCPRLRLSELSEYAEAKRPGIYFLFGNDEETGEMKVYIGEAENVFDRLQSHINNKDFWNEVIIFVSKDENLTKSHVRYLESRIIQLALSTKRYKIDNTNQSQLSSLPPADRDAMEEFLTYVKLLIGVLGHKFLEEVLAPSLRKADNQPATLPSPYNQKDSNTNSAEFFLSVSGIKARAMQTDEGMVVLKDSEAAKAIMESLPYRNRDIREKLIEKGTLKLIDDRFVFQSNTLFASPTQAAAVIVGYSINGPANWKDKTGQSLKDIESYRVQGPNNKNQVEKGLLGKTELITI